MESLPLELHLSALAEILLVYLILTVSCFGWGRAAAYLLGLKDSTTRFDIILIWLGWAFSLLIFQAMHYFFALNAYVVGPVFILGITFSLRGVANGFRRLQKAISLEKLTLVTFIALIGTVWVASRSMLSPLHGDTGLYHLQAIRWINSYPIVPGLGNLHGRLAFNQSFFTWAAALNFYPWLGHGRALSNSYLLLLTIVTFIYFLLPIINQPSLLAVSHPFQYASSLFALPLLVYLTLNSEGLASPSPDMTSTLLQVVMFILLAHEIAEWSRCERGDGRRATILAILAATAITIKLSNLAFSAVVIGLCIVRVWKSHQGLGIVRLVLPVMLILLVWMGRGYILSGAPLYPSTIGYISTDWAVPKEKVHEEAIWVYSWARSPKKHWQDVLGSWEWLGPWSMRISENSAEVVDPLLVAAVCCILMIVSYIVFPKPRWVDYLILSPTVLGLVYWFFTAPDPRFAGAVIWCLPLSSALLFLCSIQPRLGKRSFMCVMLLMLTITNYYFVDFVVRNNYLIVNVSLMGWHPLEDPQLVEKETNSGLLVLVAEKNEQCWDWRCRVRHTSTPNCAYEFPDNSDRASR